ncbi:hypothetical protein CU669_06095 [Paramagnetospirillum kuznetsovii]|uniref:BioF2-like acetyltransferase domain-containing protein n=1 Tax=Paramagnetospirillum kuznetsovii TaxID=2053833 RepID=A0A364P118_9PROT|nr:hypothetical protein [Paramagnetospirillum kuznetsovii]RAU22950.1 hypothetical protein CU669_06095 [Paramagnetospirillum kuznetsovii]
MLREKAKPVNEADAAILDVLESKDLNTLESSQSLLAPTLIEFLRALLEGDDLVGRWAELAKVLEAGGLYASAIKAYGQLAPLIPELAKSADAYAAMVALERTLRMDCAAAADQRLVNRLRGISNTGSAMPELEEGNCYVVAATNDPETYRAIEAALDDSPLRHDPLRDPVLAKTNFHTPPPPGEGIAVDDCSFFVMDGEGRPVMQVEADIYGTRHLGCRETGIYLTALVNDHPDRAVIELLAVRQLKMILEWCNAKTAVFERADGQNLAAPLTEWINESRAVPVGVTAAWIDLSLSAEEIERGYRDAHRQSLRWGRKNMEVRSTSVPDPAMIQLYTDVYTASLRLPGLSVENLTRYMAQGLFNLYIGFFENRPAVALLSSRHGSTTYYWSSTKLIVGNKPLGHMVLHQAIMDAKAEGQKRFDFGQLQTSDTFSDKLKNIALYKRGFATHTEQHFIHSTRL